MKPQSDEPNDAMREFVREVTDVQPGLRAFIGFLMSGASGVSDLMNNARNLLLG